MGKRQDSLAVTGAAPMPAPGAPLPAAAGRQDWFSARELADLAQTRGIKGWPHSEDAVKRRIKREGWDGLGEHLARVRPATGGRPGMEYHVSLLPDALQAAVHGLAGVGRQVAAVARDAEADRRRVAALRVAALRLMQAFGGRDLKFPQTPGTDHPVVKALGEADAGVLCGLLGGQQIYIPHGRRPRNQRAAVLDMERQGRTRAQIAAALGLSERHVRWLANRRPQAGPLPLFPEEN